MLISAMTFGDTKLKDGVTKFGYTNDTDVIDIDPICGGTITSLTGLDQFINAERLFLVDCNLTSLDISALTKLKELHINLNDLSTLDISSNVLLEKVYLYQSGLSSINTASNPSVEIFGL